MFYFSAFPPIQLASSFCLLEQIFFFSTFPQNSACFSFLPVGANVLFSISLPQFCFILHFCHWSNHSSYTLFTPSLLASLFCRWSKCTVFYLFAPTLLHPPVLPLEQPLFIYTLYSNPACFTFLPIGANVLFSISLPQLCFILQYYHWSNNTSYPLFTPSLLASSFCPLEQIFFFQLFPQFSLLLSSLHWGIFLYFGFSPNPAPHQSPAAFKSSAIRFDIRFIGI